MFADNEHRQFVMTDLFVPIGDNYRVIITNEGKGFSYASEVDNSTNDPTTKLPHVIGLRNRPPKMHGLDYNNDGIADNVDTNGDGALSPTAIGASIGEREYWLICSDPDNDPLTFAGQSMPANMSLNQDTGEIAFDPTPDQADNTFVPTFTCRDNRGGFDSLIAPFRVFP
jgi:hypothetical protein